MLRNSSFPVTLLFSTCLLIACNPQTAGSEIQESTFCSDCTYLIHEYDEGTYTLKDGERLCIDNTGHFAGRINRAPGTSLSNICSMGNFSPRTISLGSGPIVLENYGFFNPVNWIFIRKQGELRSSITREQSFIQVLLISGVRKVFFITTDDLPQSSLAYPAVQQ